MVKKPRLGRILAFGEQKATPDSDHQIAGPSKTELAAMFAQAVRNTARLISSEKPGRAVVKPAKGAAERNLTSSAAPTLVGE